MGLVCDLAFQSNNFSHVGTGNVNFEMYDAAYVTKVLRFNLGPTNAANVRLMQRKALRFPHLCFVQRNCHCCIQLLASIWVRLDLDLLLMLGFWFNILVKNISDMSGQEKFS